MTKLNVSLTQSMPFPRERVFAALVDPGCIQKCIDGCDQIVATGPDRYEARLRLSAASAGAIVANVQLSDRNPPESCTLIIETKEPPNLAQATFHIRLLPQGTGSELQCAVEAQVGGLLSLVGSKRLESMFQKAMADFFRKLGEVITATPA